jgi:hypothetical protein
MGLQGGSGSTPFPNERKFIMAEGVQPISTLQESGLLWLINRVVFHPRGFSLALHFNENGNCLGWWLMGDGSELWTFGDGSEIDENELFRRVENFLSSFKPGGVL